MCLLQASKAKLWKEWKWNLLNVDQRQMLGYDHLWNWTDCVIRVGYSFLCNSVHLWTVPLSFTLLMADYIH